MSDQLDANSPANRDCLAKARPGEPMFIILGRDPDGGNIVRLWAERRKAAGDAAHADPVFAIADRMDAYAADPQNASKSAPDKADYPALQGAKRCNHPKFHFEGWECVCEVCGARYAADGGA